MDPATILAIIILVVAILILLYYYLQSTNNPVYQNIHAQASGISNRVAQEEYVANISEKVNGFSDKFKDRVQDDDEEHISKTDAMSKKISQFIDEQSEQVIEDWNLATHKDLDQIIERCDALNDDFSSYKESNDARVSELEQRVNKISDELSELKK
ncbi:hypothetical protein PXD04_03310 [Methanosphaera sp. ISO3-F5]|uniref:hypothetical protein n=1 Tax=Methanosphaera sp. ISO3-F5 TaxID=1452353 RepID=UPI002B25A5AC|nr:hypothetical protein [Methanosphaera sp. ISO3-F5]WQH64829.1 hypothetical protein PXD04_03310 [Methanosphaera sp. ISO3-F5]